ncbi:Bug family tripartite tricarboxylate transporter substrate binding protein [Lampropedia puyangensis]|nr:tripartite tricarboxylate transporter substrate binding protein [Lampropedia puyangensis]
MKRTFLKTCAAIALSAWTVTVSAQPVLTKIVVPFNPGGGSDLFASLLAPELSKALGTTVIVENRAGAGGVIGADYVAKSKPDGNTLLLSDASAYSINPSLYKNLPYQKDSFIPVVDVARFANLLVVPANSPYNTLQDIITAAKANPGRLSIASSGNGSSTHLTAMHLQRAGHFELIHIPYRGSGPAFADLMGEQVDMMFSGLPAVTEYLKSKRLKAIVLTDKKRSSFAPEVPTAEEAGMKDFESYISQGLFAPAGTPAELVEKINTAVNVALSSPEVTERLRLLNAEFKPNTAQEYGAWLDAEAVNWANIIKESDVRVE